MKTLILLLLFASPVWAGGTIGGFYSVEDVLREHRDKIKALELRTDNLERKARMSQWRWEQQRLLEEQELAQAKVEKDKR